MERLELGVRGKAVKVWQLILDIEQTGIFDEFTRAKTIIFQSENNLKPDGIVGMYTWSIGLGTLSLVRY